MRLGWRPVTGVKTVQSECGILATATPAPLRKNSGKYILAQHRALLQFETQALQDRLYESHGVREASWISLSGCHPNRVQATAAGASRRLTLVVFWRRAFILPPPTLRRPSRPTIDEPGRTAAYLNSRGSVRRHRSDFITHRSGPRDYCSAGFRPGL